MKLLVVGFGHTARTATAQRVRSGGETKLLHMLPVWQKLSHNHVTYLTSSAYAARIKAEGVHVRTVTPGPAYDESRFGTFVLMLRRLLAVPSLQLPEVPDCIYSSSDLFFDVLPSVWLKRRYPRCTLVSCVFLVAPSPLKGYEQRGGTIRGRVRALGFYLLQQFSLQILQYHHARLLVLNEHDKRELMGRGFSAADIAVTSGGVDETEIRKAVPAKGKPFDAVFLGRFHPQKGIGDLPEIWSRVVKRKPTVRLAVIGGGDPAIQAALERRLEQLRIRSSVTILTNLSRPQIFSFLKRASIFVFPSHYESWGFVVAEAMAAGLPVVGYRLPFTDSVFPQGFTGVQPFDKQAFADTIISIMTDARVRARLSRAAREQGKRYSWETVAGTEYRWLLTAKPV